MKDTDPFVSQLQEITKAFMFLSMQGVIKYSKKSGYSMTHIGTLMHLQNRGKSAVSEIGDKLGITHPAVSQMLDKLVDEELIQRKEDPKDRRVKKIIITGEGTKIIHESMMARRVSLIELAEKLSDDEKEKISSAFKIILEKLNSIEKGENAIEDLGENE